MRQLETVGDEDSARRLADYLLTKGISVSVEPTVQGWNIWVRHEDHLNAARQELAAFLASPNAPIYGQAEKTAAQLRAEEETRARQAKKNYVNVRTRWRAGGAAGRIPITMLLIIASIGVTLWTDFGKNKAAFTQLTIDDYVIFQQGVALGENGDAMANLWRSEPWRLVTPIFLHMNLMHIAFNMMAFYQFGMVIEILRGSWRFLLLVLLIAIPSNFAQYLWGGPYFGGMSGVIFGLFGYVWMKSRYDPNSGFYLSQNTVIYGMGWMVLCFTGLLGPIANACHGVGLVVGMIIGRFPGLSRRIGY